MEEKINPEFAMNPDPRCACILLLDTSASMAGKRISELNEGLRTFGEELRQDLLASRRVEGGIVTFGDGGVNKIQDFVTAAQVTAPSLSAGGNTPTRRAIGVAPGTGPEGK